MRPTVKYEAALRQEIKWINVIGLYMFYIMTLSDALKLERIVWNVEIWHLKINLSAINLQWCSFAADLYSFQHFNSCKFYIVNDVASLSSMTLYTPFILGRTFSNSKTHVSYRLLRCRTFLFRNSLPLSLTNLLVNSAQKLDSL